MKFLMKKTKVRRLDYNKEEWTSFTFPPMCKRKANKIDDGIPTKQYDPRLTKAPIFCQPHPLAVPTLESTK